MTSVNNLYRVPPRMARKYVERCLKVGLVPFLQSSPGIGKSSIMKAVAEFFNLKLIDHRLSTSPPEDMSGLPAFKDGYAYFAPFAELFPVEGTPLPVKTRNAAGEAVEFYDGWLIFLDEFNSARKETQAAAYKLILDKMVGQHKLHENCAIACAGNLSTDRAIVNPLSTAMQSRVVHIEMIHSFEEWLMDVALPQNYDHRLVSFLSQHQEDLMDFRPDHSDKTFCCPRTWEFAERLIHGEQINDEDTGLLAGTITSGIAAKLVQYCKVFENIPKVEDIIADPHHHHIPRELDMIWAVTGALLSNLTAKNMDKISVYVDRLDTSFRILFYRSILARHPDLRHHQAYVKALVSLAQYLRG